MRQTSADTFFSDVNTIDPNELLQDEERSTRRHPRGTKITKYLKQFDRALGTPKENSYRKFIWGIFSLNASRYGNRTTYWPSKIFEFIIVLLIGINVCLAVIKTDPNLAGTEDFNNAYSFIIIVSFLIFGLEYGLRCWSCVEDAKYPGACSGRIVWITRPLSILDLIVLIAFMLDAISSIEQVGKGEFDLFIDWLRKTYQGKPVDLVKIAEEIASLGKDAIKQVFSYGLQFLAEINRLKILGPKHSRLNGKTLESAEKLKNLLDLNAIEKMQDLLNESSYYLERNANAKLLILNMGIQMNAIFRMR